MNNIPNIAGESSIMLYTGADNTIRLEVKLEQETVWLTQKQMAALFDVKKAAVSKHISNIYAQGELVKDATVSKMETVQNEGGRTIVRTLDYYNLDMILSVGYRVNSKSAIAFRQWASRILKDYIVKGYAVRDQLQLQHYNELKNIVSLMSRCIVSLLGRCRSSRFNGRMLWVHGEERHSVCS